MEVFVCEPHLDKTLPGEHICGAAVVDEDPTNVIPREVHRISTNVCSNYEGIIVRIVLKSEVSFGEGNWDVGPGGAEMFAFADVRDCAEVFFPLTLRLMYWLIGSAGDGVDDIHRASDRIICSLWDRAWL